MASPFEMRIKNIQKNLKVPQTGIFDLVTCKAFETLRNIKPPAGNDLVKHKKEIQKALGFTGRDVDGMIGTGSISRIELIFDKALPTLPVATSMIVSKKGIDVIIEAEVSSKRTYDSKYQSPMWPGGQSGVTIGIGYDLGYYSANGITQDWQGKIPAKDLNLLLSVAGLTGEKAKAAVANNSNNIKSAVIPWDKAIEVFYTKSLPVYAKLTLASFPGAAALQADAQAALVSLVYNRGNSLKDTPGQNRRLEMRNMVPLVAAKDLKGIAAQFRAMKRLWSPPVGSGLITRREREAVLVENASHIMAPDEFIFI